MEVAILIGVLVCFDPGVVYAIKRNGTLIMIFISKRLKNHNIFQPQWK